MQFEKKHSYYLKRWGFRSGWEELLCFPNLIEIILRINHHP